MRKVFAKMVPKNLTTEQKACLVSWSSGLPWEGARILHSRYHRWWIMDFGIRPQDKTPKSGVAHCKLSPSQESENKQIQNQIDAHLFFWQSGDRPQGICATRTNCQSNFSLGSPSKTQEKGGTCVTRHCTTTTPHVTRQSPSMNFWQKKAFLWFLSPPYLPDLNPCDFFLFSRLKYDLKECHFCTLDNIQKSVTNKLKGIPAEAFQHCYEQWKQRLRRCVAAQWNYFEGGNLDL